MAKRATWRGHLKLSLVTCAVELYPATAVARPSFRTINRQTGHRVKRLYVDAETQEIVDAAQQAKAYVPARTPNPPSPTDNIDNEPPPGRPASRVVRPARPAVAAAEVDKALAEADVAPPVAWPSASVRVEPGELEALRPEQTHLMELGTFVPAAEVDPRYLDAPYYLAPADEVAQEAYFTIRDAMQDAAVAGLARMVLARRERIVLLQPWQGGMLATTMRYADEIRSSEAVFRDLQGRAPTADMKEMAEILIQRRTGRFGPELFTNTYGASVADLLRSKQDAAPVAASAPASNVVDLMEALRRSIASEGPESPAKSKPGSPAGRARPGTPNRRA